MKSGYDILRQRTRSFEATIKALEDCERQHRKYPWDCGCDNCEVRRECVREFDYQVNNRTTGTWKLGTHSEETTQKRISFKDWVSTLLRRIIKKIRKEERKDGYQRNNGVRLV